MPSLSLSEIDEMTLLEIDDRLFYIIDAKREQQKYFLKDLSSLIFYGVAYGYAATKSNKGNFESKYHNKISKLLGIDAAENENSNPEVDLKKVFG